MTMFTAATLILASIIFVVYWILGGVFFAAVSIAQVIKLRRTRFSVMFTMLSAVCAYAAARTGLYLGQDSIRPCVAEAGDRVERLSAALACGVLEEMTAGAIWFIALIGFGFIILFLSRAENQSWIDTDFRLREQPDGKEF